MKRLLHRHADILVMSVVTFIFVVWPQMDLVLAAWFYEPGSGFVLARAWWVQLAYIVIAKLWVLAFVWLFLLLIGFLPGFQRWAPPRAAVVYLLAVLVVGPGLVVNSLLKNYWGRPRPVHLALFGSGHATFTPALQPGRQCARNCAFVSGHAAAGFYPMAGFWLTRRRRWLAGGIALGLFVGFTRMAMGAHFLSDVLFAGMVVYITCRLLSFLLPRHAGMRSVQPAQRSTINRSMV